MQTCASENGSRNVMTRSCISTGACLDSTAASSSSCQTAMQRMHGSTLNTSRSLSDSAHHSCADSPCCIGGHVTCTQQRARREAIIHLTWNQESKQTTDETREQILHKSTSYRSFSQRSHRQFRSDVPCLARTWRGQGPPHCRGPNLIMFVRLLVDLSLICRPAFLPLEHVSLI